MSPEQKIPINVFLLGFAWTFVGAVAPSCGVFAMWKAGLASAPDWPTLWHHAVFTGGVAALGFWRKHVAYLALPPTLEAAKRLMEITTTVRKTVNPTTTVTVEEKHVEEK